jgi:hypothetical protein
MGMTVAGFCRSFIFAAAIATARFGSACADEPSVYTSSRNSVWASIEVINAVKISEEHLSAQKNLAPWQATEFSAYIEADKIYVKLGRSKVGKLPESSWEEVGAYFMLRRHDLEVLKFDLCSKECGIFFVTWFKQPKNATWHLKKKP